MLGLDTEKSGSTDGVRVDDISTSTTYNLAMTTNALAGAFPSSVSTALSDPGANNSHFDDDPMPLSNQVIGKERIATDA